MQKNYYAIIPANVRYDKELTPNAKLLYGEITALCNEKGYCWATNSYFSELYGVSKKSISKWINQLIDKGYVSTDLQYKEGTKEVSKRHLRIIQGGMEEKFHRGGRKVQDPIEEKFHTPMEEKFKDNNTSFNTTNKNGQNEFDQFWSIYPRKVKKKVAFDKFKTARKKHSLETILTGTKKYVEQTKVEKTPKNYIMHPSTFLNQEAFIDGFEERTEEPNKPSNPQYREFTKEDMMFG